MDNEKYTIKVKQVCHIVIKGTDCIDLEGTILLSPENFESVKAIRDLTNKDKLYDSLNWNFNIPLPEGVNIDQAKELKFSLKDGDNKFFLCDDIKGVPIDKELALMTDEELEKVVRFYFEKFRRIKYRGMLPSSLSREISKEQDPELFEKIPIDKRIELEKSDKINLVNRQGKGIALTDYQYRIVLALNHYLTQSLNVEELEEYLSSMEKDIKNAPGREEKINVAEFVKTYFSRDGRLRNRDLAKCCSEMRKIGEIRQVFTLEDKKRKYRFTTPLFTIEEEMEIEDKESSEDNISFHLANIRFSKLFFKNISKEYFPYNLEVIRLMGQKGSGADTELFRMLFADIASKYPFYRQTAKTNEAKVRRADYKTKEEYLDAVEKAKKEGLTYTQKLITLRNRIPVDYESTKQYRAKFRKDIERALSLLQDEIKVISSWSYSNNPDGDKMLSVVFNENYNARLIGEKSGE